MNIEPPKAKSAVANESKAKVTDTASRLRASAKPEKAPLPAAYDAIHIGIVDVLQAARVQAVRNVNALVTASYWEVGRRIVEAEQKGKRRAGYGDALVERLAIDLTARFGRGFGVVNLSQMRVLYSTWPPEAIFQTLSEKLMLKTSNEPPVKLGFRKLSLEELATGPDNAPAGTAQGRQAATRLEERQRRRLRGRVSKP